VCASREQFVCSHRAWHIFKVCASHKKSLACSLFFMARVCLHPSLCRLCACIFFSAYASSFVHRYLWVSSLLMTSFGEIDRASIPFIGLFRLSARFIVRSSFEANAQASDLRASSCSMHLFRMSINLTLHLWHNFSPLFCFLEHPLSSCLWAFLYSAPFVEHRHFTPSVAE